MRPHYVFLGSVAGSMLLAGCPIPIPPGYESDSRHHMMAEVPSFIVIGKTTREDVVFELGEPDGAAVDESWLSYGSSYRHAGVFFCCFALWGAGAIPMEYRRLIVQFDKQGRANGVTLESKKCWGDSEPCLDPASRDLPLGPGKKE